MLKCGFCRITSSIVGVKDEAALVFLIVSPWSSRTALKLFTLDKFRDLRMTGCGVSGCLRGGQLRMRLGGRGIAYWRNNGRSHCRQEVEWRWRRLQISSSWWEDKFPAWGGGAFSPSRYLTMSDASSLAPSLLIYLYTYLVAFMQVRVFHYTHWSLENTY